jgi:hypothetical protein
VVPKRFRPAPNIGGFDESFPRIPAAACCVHTVYEWLRQHNFHPGHSAQHYGATGQRHGHTGPDGYFFRGRNGDFAFELPVAEKQRKYQCSDWG